MITIFNPGKPINIPGVGDIGAGQSTEIDEALIISINLPRLVQLAAQGVVIVSKNFNTLPSVKAALLNIPNGSEPASRIAVWSTTDGAARGFTGGNRGSPTLGSGWRTLGSDVWQVGGNANSGRSSASMVALPGGRALVCGGVIFSEPNAGPGEQVSGKMLATDVCEMWDSLTGRMTVVAPMPAARWGAGIAFLPTVNKVLVVGGYSGAALAANIVNTTFLYDIATDTWSTVGAYPTTVSWGLTYNNTLSGGLCNLKDGKVLAVGGLGPPSILTGTVTVTNGMPAIVGVGTLFTTQLVVGGLVQFGNQLGTVYTILSITDDLNLTLTATFTGATLAGTTIVSGVGPPAFLTGTVALTNGSAAVVGTGTLFTTELVVGQTIQFGNQFGTVYTVLTITDDLNITLVTTFTGTTTASTSVSTFASQNFFQMEVVSGRSTAAVFTPGLNTWAATANTLSFVTIEAHLARLEDGRVLVTGGANLGPLSNDLKQQVATCMIYNPTTNTFSASAPMPSVGGEDGANNPGNRTRHIALALRDGRVFVGLGQVRTAGPNAIAARRSCLIYDPQTNAWTVTATTPLSARRNIIGLVLHDGRVYVGAGDPVVTNSAELTDGAIYNPVTNTWVSGASMPNTGDGFFDPGIKTAFYISLSQCSVVLSDGKLLISGGGKSATDITAFTDFAGLIDPANTTNLLYVPPTAAIFPTLGSARLPPP
jgi:hypothetical protein